MTRFRLLVVAAAVLFARQMLTRYREGGAAEPGIELIVHTAHADAADRARVLAGAMSLVRDLVNTSPADMVPADLAAAAGQAAAAHGLNVQVLDENELLKEGFGGILAVGMGSVHPPRLVRLEYTHPDAARTVVFAGKGITFDSGGLSLKPPKAMETMKADMSGAAAVLAAVQAIAELRPAVNVVGYLSIAFLLRYLARHSTAVFAPMPNARVIMAIAVRPGRFKRFRTP